MYTWRKWVRISICFWVWVHKSALNNEILAFSPQQTAANFSRKPPLLPHISVVIFHLNLWRHAPTRSHCFYPWCLRLAGQGMAKIRLEKNGSLMIHYSKRSQNRPRNYRNYLRKTQLFHSTFQSRLFAFFIDLHVNRGKISVHRTSS